MGSLQVWNKKEIGWRKNMDGFMHECIVHTRLYTIYIRTYIRKARESEIGEADVNLVVTRELTLMAKEW